MAIKLLPSQVANQIAAGEVVERPSAVVKELVENALDAHATKIILELEGGGSKRILVRDNGVGISKEDLPLALRRHATSKISSIDDLDNLLSMGFRGEALASIAAVSRLTLTSKPSVQEAAYAISVDGVEQVPEISAKAHPNGTSVEVCDLFFNTPARRRFLRSEKTEFLKIEEIFKRLALSRPDVEFCFKNNGKIIYDLKVATNDELIRKRLGKIVGNKFAIEALDVNQNCGVYSLYGFFDPIASVKGGQYFFVNNRIVKDKLIISAIKNALTLENRTEDASYVLFLQLPQQEVDINVHPQKFEVRFANSREIYDFISGVIVHTLRVSEQVLPETYEETIHPDLTHNYSSISANLSPRVNQVNFYANSNASTNANVSVSANSQAKADGSSAIYNKIFAKGRLSSANNIYKATENLPSNSVFGKNSGFLGEALCYGALVNSNNFKENNNEQSDISLNVATSSNSSIYKNTIDNSIDTSAITTFNEVFSNPSLELVKKYFAQFLPWEKSIVNTNAFFKALSVYKLNYAIIYGSNTLRLIKIKCLSAYLYRNFLLDDIKEEKKLFTSIELVSPLKLNLFLCDEVIRKLSVYGFKFTAKKDSIIVEAVPFLLRFNNLAKVLSNLFTILDVSSSDEMYELLMYSAGLTDFFPCFFTTSQIEVMLSYVNTLEFWEVHPYMSIAIDLDEVIAKEEQHE